MRIPLLDLSFQNDPHRAEILAAIARVAESGAFILGEEVSAFEKELGHVLGVGRDDRAEGASARSAAASERDGAITVVGASSGTDALLVALMALGVGAGDDVITSPFTFFATGGVVARLGARPVFVDIEPNTFNLDPNKAAQAITAKTKAVMPVHLFGRPAAMVDTHVPVIEDAAQSISAAPLKGRAGCLSFFPSKNLGAFGDAGAVYTDDAAFADRVRLLRTHGGRPKYYHHAIGGNFRLDAVQAAVLRVKLPHLEGWTRARRDNAASYRRLFANQAGIPSELVLPEHHEQHIYNQFVLRAPRRDALREHLAKAGVGTEIYYPVPLHLQPCFASLGYRSGSLPEAEAAAREALAIPIYPGLRPEQQAFVVEQIAEFYRS